MTDAIERLSALHGTAAWIGEAHDAWPAIESALRAAQEARRDIEEARDDKLCEAFYELSDCREVRKAGEEANDASRRLSALLEALDAIGKERT